MAANLNVLYLINHAGKGGSEKYAAALAGGISGRANVFFVYNEEGRLCGEMAPFCQKTMKLVMRNPFDFKAARKLAAFVRDNNINVIHAQYPRENYIAVLAKLFCPGVKIVYTAHWNTRDSALRTLLNRFFTRFDAAAIAVGTQCARILEQNGYPKRRIKLVFPGIKLAARDKAFVFPKDIETEGFVFLCVSRLSEEKGLLFLLESLYELKQMTNKPFTLLIAGDGGQYDELLRKTKELELDGNVRFLGYRNDIVNLMSGAGAYVNPAQTESFGFATVEAMERSLPVIVTDVGGSRDIVNEKTNCGIRVSYGDKAGFASAMKELMDNDEKRRRYSENAYSAVCEYFSEERFINQTFGIYEACLKIHNKEGL